MKKIILITFMLILSACTLTKSYNTPFINADETIQLQEGMSKNDVFEKIGEPIHVDYGINGTIVWIYEVRTITVKSHTSSTGEISPNKTNDDVKHSNPIHKLKVVFVDDKIESWDRIDFENNTESPTESPEVESLSRLQKLIEKIKTIDLSR